MAAIEISRGSLNLPSQISSEILQKTQEQSAVMSLARQITLPGNGLTIPVITGDAEASWVNETEQKPVKRSTLTTKLMTPYTLAVIVPFSNQFKRDAATLYAEIVRRLPLALAKQFDATVFGAVTKPGDNFDTLASCTTQNLSTNAYKALVDAQADIADHDGDLNGWILSPKAKSVLLNAVDGNKRPLFINNVADGALPVLLGHPVYSSKAANVSANNVVGVAGDWSQAMYGTVEGMKVDISDQATLTDGSTTINLFQQNMFAVRCEIEVGFRCDSTVFNLLTISAG